MPVDRTHITHQARYLLRDGAALRCVLAFDTGDGDGRARWKVLLPGPAGTEDLCSIHQFLRPDAAQLTAWLTPNVSADAATELATAVHASPPPAAGWQRMTDE
jgi:hypothetical protein